MSDCGHSTLYVTDSTMRSLEITPCLWCQRDALAAQLRAIDIACKAVAAENEQLKAALHKIVAMREDMRIATLEAALRKYVDQTTIGSPYGADGLAGAIAHHQMWAEYFTRVLAALSGPADANQHEWRDDKCLRCGCLIHHVAAICLCNGTAHPEASQSAAGDGGSEHGAG